ncbi:urease accessory protein UreG [Agilicoccus flavus]|uniref:urease accessory protein UreG n=1 Tax=Agilicoccus flavus TaxID=2775968 RepID=UPI0027D9D759|nr:urease accessory protein UreG [Agilicoccus flavus]
MPESTRPFRLGIAGPVGTGKSSLIGLLCAHLSDRYSLGVVTNDIYTDEDARMLRAAGVLDPERIRAVETGACPHTAIRDDITPNLAAVEDLEADFAPLDLVLVESGGDNLTATFSPALVDAQIFVLDVAGGGDVVRKGGPGIARADLLVVNKTDLAPHVGVDAALMEREGRHARDGRPVVALSRLDPASVEALCGWVEAMIAAHAAGDHTPIDPGPMAPHSHGPDEPAHAHGPAGPGHTHGPDDPAHGPDKPAHRDGRGGTGHLPGRAVPAHRHGPSEPVHLHEHGPAVTTSQAPAAGAHAR